MSDENATQIAGVGPTDAVVANEKGGLQSPVPYRFDLLDPTATLILFDAFQSVQEAKNPALLPGTVHEELDDLITSSLAFLALHYHVASFPPVPPELHGRDLEEYRFEDLPVRTLFNLAGVLAEGARKYAPNNWRKIPVADHVNHALGHAFAYLASDTQDDHLGHCFCRMHMSVAMAAAEMIPFDNLSWLSRAYVHSMLAVAASLEKSE